MGEEDWQAKLLMLVETGPAKVARLACYLQNHLDDVAFLSMRALAKRAQSDPNVVMRVARMLGFDGFGHFRQAIQEKVRSAPQSYAQRAMALQAQGDKNMAQLVATSMRRNEAALFTAENIQVIDQMAEHLVAAKHVLCVGVRSCFALVHYFAYGGRMAFPQFLHVPTEPGDLVEQVSKLDKNDILFTISYAHYSAEIMQSCKIAHDVGARILLFTDRHDAPMVALSNNVLVLPISGPQLLPTLTPAFLAAELLLSDMVSKDPKAAQRIATHEKRLQQYAAYWPS